MQRLYFKQTGRRGQSYLQWPEAASLRQVKGTDIKNSLEAWRSWDVVGAGSAGRRGGQGAGRGRGWGGEGRSARPLSDVSIDLNKAFRWF